LPYWAKENGRISFVHTVPKSITKKISLVTGSFPEFVDIPFFVMEKGFYVHAQQQLPFLPLSILAHPRSSVNSSHIPMHKPVKVD
jgi:hypothetical protein